MTELSPIGAVTVPPFMLRDDGNLLAGKVRGNSMIGDHIRDGDCILVAPDLPARNGDIAVVLCTSDGGTRGRVIKHVWRKDGNLILTSSNPAFPPVTVTPEADPVIVGVVVGIVRDVG